MSCGCRSPSLLAVLAVLAGVLASRVAPTAVAVAVAVAAGAAGQAVRRRLEHAADRWVLGARLAGYANLSRFGESLTRGPGSDGLLRDLAGEVRRGLALTWSRVTLEAAGGPPRVVTDGTPSGEPAATVPIEYHGAVLGRIECGPRSDGPLLAEDRRLLAYFAAQAAVGVHNLHLAAELSRRVEEVRDQAAELAASRDRVVAGQDAERRRIQRILHDGVQQEIVALSARAGLVRQQLLRGDPAAAEGLAEMQRDLATTLHDVREIAYAIHPPVLSDRGLLEAIEAQSSRLAVPMAVRADPRLRGVRFGEQIEATAWYVLAEALSNVVKHARASEVEVSLSQEDGRLGLVIRDDGCGFDPGRPRGLGLTGLSDRLDTVGGSLTITSGAGLGTSVCAHIPVGPDQNAGYEPAGFEPRPAGSTRMPEPLRIVTADDNYLVREGVRRLLEDSGDVLVEAAVGSAPELLDAVGRLRPAAVLTDIRMPASPGGLGERPSMEGIDAAHAIRSAYPGTGVVVLSQYADESYAFELFRDGTAGLAYLLKDRIGEVGRLLEALREVSAGGSLIDPQVVEALVRGRARVRASALKDLTPRELDVLREMAPGRGNAGIAAHLHLSESSVEKHVNAIFTKLGLTTEDLSHRRVTAVLTFLRDAGLRG